VGYNKLGQLSLFSSTRNISSLLDGITFYFKDVKKSAPKKAKAKKPKPAKKKKAKKTAKTFVMEEAEEEPEEEDLLSITRSPSPQPTQATQPATPSPPAARKSPVLYKSRCNKKQRVVEEEEEDKEEELEEILPEITKAVEEVKEIKLYDMWAKAPKRFTAENIIFNPRVIDPNCWKDSEEYTSFMVNTFPGYKQSLDWYEAHYNKTIQNPDNENTMKLLNYWIKMGLCGGKGIEDSTKAAIKAKMDTIPKKEAELKALDEYLISIKPEVEDAKKLKERKIDELSSEQEYELWEMGPEGKRCNTTQKDHNDCVSYHLKLTKEIQHLKDEYQKEETAKAQKEIDENFNYLKNLLYYIIRYPWLKSGILILMYGEQGSGKSVFWQRFAKAIYGQDSCLYTPFNDSDQLFGHFQSESLNRCKIAHLDEAYIPTEHISKLKGTTTERIVTSNQKFKEILPAINYLQYVWTCNKKMYNDSLAKIEEDDRRYFVLEAYNIFSDNSRMDQLIDLFTEEIWDAFIGSILLDPINKDINDSWNPQVYRPVTRFFIKQKEASFNDVQRWWFDCLVRRYHTTTQDTIDVSDADPKEVLWFTRANIHAIWNQFWKDMNKNSNYNNTHNFKGQWADCIKVDNDRLSKMITEDVLKPNWVDIPPLNECREMFIKKFKLPRRMLGLSETESTSTARVDKAKLTRTESILDLSQCLNI